MSANNKLPLGTTASERRRKIDINYVQKGNKDQGVDNDLQRVYQLHGDCMG